VIVGLLKPICDFVDTLVHPSAQDDAMTSARHRAFIAPRLLGSLLALASFPIYLAIRGIPTGLEIAVFIWLLAPVAVAYFLSRTGRYESAHILSSLALTGLVTALAWHTGGAASFAAIWLVVVPLEAALSASRRVVALASGFALAAAGLLLVLGTAGTLAESGTLEHQQAVLAALSIISAALYATGLALGAETLARTSAWLLTAEENRYRLLAQNMTDVITRHGRNGAVMFVSPAAGALFGARGHELRGHGLFDRVHVADRPAYLTALADAAAGGDSSAAEFRVRRSAADGRFPEFVWVEMRCRPVDQSWRGEALREVVAVMRDVTARKTQEQVIEDARREFEQTNAAKTRFLATMSHELRTPLNAIIGFSEMLTQEEQMRLDQERRQEYARLINDSGHHLLAVVNGILDMSKMETGDFEITPEPFAPAQVVGGCCDLLALKAREAGIELAIELAADLPDIVADKRAVKQIMINLLSNALKFTDRGGRVAIAAEVDSDDIVFAVTDTGIGISEADLPRLGNPFFQARSAYDRRHDGTGLGLSIVKGLVALHGGDVKVESVLGKGTSVVIRLPLDCERRKADQSNVAQPDFAHGREPKPAETVSEQEFEVRKSA
jgi:cell cycle sensor histidine kinase DivJ